MTSRAECIVPLRNFLGTPHGLEVARACGRMRIAWILGACTVLSLGLIYSYFVTKRQEEEYLADPTNVNPTVVVPLWLCALPIAFAMYTYFSAVSSAEQYWRAEELNFNTSEMPKSEFLNYRIADDRQKTGHGVSMVNTGVIGSTALFGAYLRGDPR
jgi:hypothetical protein